MSFQTNIQIDQAELNRMLRSPRGEVGRYIQKLGRATVVEAKRQAPVSSGRLRNSIEITMWPGPNLALEVSANIYYALAVHEGTKPHTIKGKPFVKFPSKKSGGRTIALRSVDVDGQKANPFLMRALKTVVKTGA